LARSPEAILADPEGCRKERDRARRRAPVLAHPPALYLFQRPPSAATFSGH